MLKQTRVLQEMMKTLGRKELGAFVNEVYYKDAQPFFDLFILVVDDILHGRSLAHIHRFIDGTDEEDIPIVLSDVCDNLGWPIRYCQQLLRDLIKVCHGTRNSSSGPTGQVTTGNNRTTVVSSLFGSRTTGY